MTWADDYANVGARYLDGHEPGWAARIDPAKVDMESPCGCVLGQLWGDFHDVLRDFGWSLSQAAQLGFTIPAGRADTDENWAELDRAWTDEVLGRRELAEVTG